MTHARCTSHTTPNMRCAKILYKCQIQWVKPSQTPFWALLSLSRQLLVRVVNHTLLLIQSVSWFSTHVRSVSWPLTETLFNNFESFAGVNRARKKSYTTPNTTRRCVTIPYKYQFNWVKPLHSNLWTPPSCSRKWVVREVNHTLLLTQSVSRFSTQVSSVT